MRETGRIREPDERRLPMLTAPTPMRECPRRAVRMMIPPPMLPRRRKRLAEAARSFPSDAQCERQPPREHAARPPRSRHAPALSPLPPPYETSVHAPAYAAYAMNAPNVAEEMQPRQPPFCAQRKGSDARRHGRVGCRCASVRRSLCRQQYNASASPGTARRAEWRYRGAFVPPPAAVFASCRRSRTARQRRVPPQRRGDARPLMLTAYCTPVKAAYDVCYGAAANSADDEHVRTTAPPPR